jgi:tetratricopeptide (TPR) repeat protein
LLAIYEPVFAVARYHQSIGLPDTRTIAKQWIGNNLRRGSAIAVTSMRVKFPDTTYQILTIPFFPMVPERVEPFYDTRWFEDFDLVMGSDFDLGRFQQDPKRYAKFITFYETLKDKWTLAYEVKPDGDQPGPRIWLYRAPDSLRRSSFPAELFKPFYRTGDSSKCGAFLQIVSVIMMKKRQLEKAEQATRNLAFFEPDNFEPLRMLLTSFKESGQLERAIPIANTYLRLRPQNAELLCLHGWIYYTLERYDEAEIFFKQALVCDPNYGSAYTDLFAIYAGRKDKGKAIDILSRYLAILTPGSERARTIQSYIDEIKTY